MANEEAWNIGANIGTERAREHRAHKQALSDQELEGKIKDLIDQRSGLVSKISALDKDSPEYKQAFDALKQVNTGLIDVYHPQKNPGAIQKFGHLLTDHLKLTSPEKRQEKKEAIATKEGKTVEQQAQQEVAAGPLSPAQESIIQANATAAGQLAAIQGAVKNFNATHPDATQDEKQEFLGDLIQKAYGTTTSGNWEIVTGTIDGEPVSLDHDKKTNKYRYHSGEAVPEDKMIAFIPAPKTKPAAKKGLKIDTNTGQVVDQDTAKRYNRDDPSNPPEVTAMFKGMDWMTGKKQQFQEKLAQMRGASYGLARQMGPLPVLDTANQNAPTYATYLDMKKHPGRYLPASASAKALAQENLMEDIKGTSSQTRQAIVGLKENFPEDMKVKIVLAMGAENPSSALDQLIASGALGSLTADQQDFMIATQQLAENAMAMRSILGAGQGSEDMRNAIRATLPTLLSPDKSYALRQLDAFDKTINRLQRGVPKVPLRTDTGAGGGGGLTQRTGSKPQGAIGTVTHNGKKYWVDAEGNNLGAAQ